MPNPFFEAMVGISRGNPIQGGIPSKQVLVQAAQQFKANPFRFIMQQKLNIPANIMNNPEAMLDYLLQTKQINPSRVDWARQQMAQQGMK